MKLPAQVSSFSESSPSVLSLQLKGDSGCLRASTGVLPGAGDGQELWRAPAEDACVYPHASVGSRRGEHLRTDSLGFLSCQPRVRLLPMATDLVRVTRPVLLHPGSVATCSTQPLREQQPGLSPPALPCSHAALKPCTAMVSPLPPKDVQKAPGAT